MKKSKLVLSGFCAILSASSALAYYQPWVSLSLTETKLGLQTRKEYFGKQKLKAIYIVNNKVVVKEPTQGKFCTLKHEEHLGTAASRPFITALSFIPAGVTAGFSILEVPFNPKDAGHNLASAGRLVGAAAGLMDTKPLELDGSWYHGKLGAGTSLNGGPATSYTFACNFDQVKDRNSIDKFFEISAVNESGNEESNMILHRAERDGQLAAVPAPARQIATARDKGGKSDTLVQSSKKPSQKSGTTKAN